jgi:DNA repair protein RadA/Sms
VAVAVASAAIDQPIGAGDVVIGEIGLGGEVRQVTHARRRLGEAARIGFRRAIVPASSPPCDGIDVIRVRTVAEALGAVGIAGGPNRRSSPAGPSP